MAGTNLVGEGTHGSVWVLDDNRVVKQTQVIDKRSYGTYLSDGLVTELAALERIGNACCRHVVKAISWEGEGAPGKNFKSKLVLQRLVPLANIDEDMLRSGARNYIKQLLEAISDLHAAHVAHCDLKLDNVMYDFGEDELKIIDFGLAKMDSGVKPPDKALFTFDYRPPEALLMAERIDLRKADMWSIGVCAASIMLGMGEHSVYYDKMYDLGWAGSLDVILRSLDATLPPKISPHYRFTEYAKSRENARTGWKNPGWLLAKISAVVGEDGANFVARLLDVNPHTRMTAREAMRHPYLAKSVARTFEKQPRTTFPFPPAAAAPSTDGSVDPRIINEIIAACVTEKLCPETAFKALDILSILPDDQRSDPQTVASALMVASAVGESRLIHMGDLFKTVAPWTKRKAMMQSVCEMLARPGVIPVLASHTVLHKAHILNQKVRGTKEDPVVQKLFQKYVDRNGQRPREIDIIDCLRCCYC